MRYLLILLYLIILVFALGLCGCKQVERKQKEDTRFIELYTQNFGHPMNGGCAIVKDLETEKKYLFVKFGYGGGLCELKED